MTAMPRRSIVLHHEGQTDPCAHCGARERSVCDSIPEADLARLAAIAIPGRAAAGTCFIDEGEPATAFFNMTGGTARLYKLLPDGRRQIVGFVGMGHFLGLAVSETYAFTAEAIEPVAYCRFPRASLRRLMDDFPALEQKLLAVASNELVAAQEQMLLLGRKTARERVASFLMAQARLGVPCMAPRAHFTLPMTRGDIADYLGLTIETVSRTLTKLRIEGVIEVPGAADIVVKNLRSLERIAGASDPAAAGRPQTE